MKEVRHKSLTLCDSRINLHKGKSIEIDRGLGVLRDEEEGARPVAGVGFPLGIIETLWNEITVVIA